MSDIVLIESSGKILLDPETKKVLTAPYSGQVICPRCPGGVAPEQIRVTFSEITNCHPTCSWCPKVSVYKHLIINDDPNDTIICNFDQWDGFACIWTGYQLPSETYVTEQYWGSDSSCPPDAGGWGKSIKNKVTIERYFSQLVITYEGIPETPHTSTPIFFSQTVDNMSPSICVAGHYPVNSDWLSCHNVAQQQWTFGGRIDIEEF